MLMLLSKRQSATVFSGIFPVINADTPCDSEVVTSWIKR